MRINKTLLTTFLILGLMILGALLGIYTNQYYQRGPGPESIPGLLWPNPKQLTAFSTVDHTGKAFGLERLQGKWSLLFFGYTYCPDVCPVTLSVLGQIDDRVQQQVDTGVQTVFISVDPARDTTARLADYIGYFNPDFVALGGTLEQIKGLTSQIGIAWSHGAASSDGNYLVNHSTSLFLLDPSARLVGIFSAPHNGESILTGLVNITDFIKNQD